MAAPVTVTPEVDTSNTSNAAVEMREKISTAISENPNEVKIDFNKAKDELNNI